MRERVREGKRQRGKIVKEREINEKVRGGRYTRERVRDGKSKREIN